MVGLLAIKIVDALPVDVLLPARPVLRVERFQVVRKARRTRHVSHRVVQHRVDLTGRQSARLALMNEQPQHVGQLSSAERRDQVVWHERPHLAPEIDRFRSNCELLIGGRLRRIAQDEFRFRLTNDVASMRLPRVGDDQVGFEFRLHSPLRPEDRLNDFFRLPFLADLREVRPDRAAVHAELVAAQARRLCRAERGKASPGMALRFGFRKQIRDQIGRVLQRGAISPCKQAGPRSEATMFRHSVVPRCFAIPGAALRLIRPATGIRNRLLP